MRDHPSWTWLVTARERRWSDHQSPSAARVLIEEIADLPASIVALESKLTLEATLAHLDLSEFRWFLDTDDPRRGEPFTEYVRRVVTRAYEMAAEGR